MRPLSIPAKLSYSPNMRQVTESQNQLWSITPWVGLKFSSSLGRGGYTGQEVLMCAMPHSNKYWWFFKLYLPSEPFGMSPTGIVRTQTTD